MSEESHNFEMFTGKKNPGTFEVPAVTISNSQINFNQKAVDKYGLRKGYRATLYFDIIHRVIGIRLNGPTNEYEYAVSEKNGGKNCAIGCRNFIKHNQIGKAIGVELKETEDGMIIVDLPEGA